LDDDLNGAVLYIMRKDFATSYFALASMLRLVVVMNVS